MPHEPGARAAGTEGSASRGERSALLADARSACDSQRASPHSSLLGSRRQHSDPNSEQRDGYDAYSTGMSRSEARTRSEAFRDGFLQAMNDAREASGQTTLTTI